MVPRLVEAVDSGRVDSLSVEELDAIDDAVSEASAGPWTPFIEDEQPIGGCSMIWAGDEPDSPDPTSAGQP